MYRVRLLVVIYAYYSRTLAVVSWLASWCISISRKCGLRSVYFRLFF